MAFSLFELSRVLGRKAALYTFQHGPLVERFNSTDRDLTIGGDLPVPEDVEDLLADVDHAFAGLGD